MIPITDDLVKKKKKSLSQVLFQRSYFTHCLFERQSQISAVSLCGRFLSKSDVGLKNLISSPTSSPHKTISFLPPTAFLHGACSVQPTGFIHVVLFACVPCLYPRAFWSGFKLQHAGYSPTLCVPWFLGLHSISASEFSQHSRHRTQPCYGVLVSSSITFAKFSIGSY